MNTKPLSNAFALIVRMFSSGSQVSLYDQGLIITNFNFLCSVSDRKLSKTLPELDGIFLSNSPEPVHNQISCLYNVVPRSSAGTEFKSSSLWDDFHVVFAVIGRSISSFSECAKVTNWDWNGDELIPKTTRLNSYSSSYFCDPRSLHHIFSHLGFSETIFNAFK